jgi:predicted enzyme related to lactoylglutathione lyase
MLGWPEPGWHLELVFDPSVARPPTEEDLLVIYLANEIDDELTESIEAAGGTRVRARNPYWEEHGATYVDPDGYRLVLSSRAWD